MTRFPNHSHTGRVLGKPSDTVWRFKIRDGVKFHDGSTFTAEDAAFSIQRAMAQHLT